MTPMAGNALRGAVIATALVAVLTGQAFAQALSEDQKRYEAQKKARELKEQDSAYKSATDVIPTKQFPIDPWGNVRPNSPPPSKDRR